MTEIKTTKAAFNKGKSDATHWGNDYGRLLREAARIDREHGHDLSTAYYNGAGLGRKTHGKEFSPA